MGIIISSNISSRFQRVLPNSGYFDISYGGTDKTFWNFDREMKQLPNPEWVKDHLKLVNYKNILLNEAHQSVF
jgi:thiamine biosynthesis lipoprotein